MELVPERLPVWAKSDPGDRVNADEKRVPMLFEFEGNLYESLSLAVARHTLGDPGIAPGYQYAMGDAEAKRRPNLEWLQVGDRRIPVDHLHPFRTDESIGAGWDAARAADALANELRAADLPLRDGWPIL